MRKCYTIPSLKSLSTLPKLDTVQFTLNGRVFPAKRNTVKLLQDCKDDVDIIIHYDFIYIISRYLFFASRVRKAIIEECVSICDYAETDSRIKGIVMHTDFPISSVVLNSSTPVECVSTNYNSSLWDTTKVVSAVASNNYDYIVNESIDQFYLDFKSVATKEYRCKIYIENSTKSYKDSSTLKGLTAYFFQRPFTTDVFGLCVDTEHSYATGGVFPEYNVFLASLQHNKVPFIVHLNTIPDGVASNSRLDRHSFTTLQECSVNCFFFYKRYINYLESNSIPYVREVKQETMLREIEQNTKRNCYA